MALLRPCGKLAQALGKSLISCQIDYNRGFACIGRIQGYVTVSTKFDCPITNIKKSDISNNNRNNNNNDNNENFTINEIAPTGAIYWQLLQLCRYARNGELRNQDLLRIIEIDDNAEKESSSNTLGLSLLRCCGHYLPNVKPADRQNLTDRVWNLINQKLSTPTLAHYNALLSVYAKNCRSVDPKKFLQSMKVSADVETHALLLNCAAKCGDVEYSLYVLSLMKQTGCSLNEAIFDSLIESHTTRGDVKSALANLETMRDAGIQPTSQTWTIIACGYASNGDISEVTKIANTHSLSLEQIMEIIKRLSLSENGKIIGDLLKFLPSSVDFNNLTIVETINELTYAGKCEDALAIVARLTTNESSEARDTFYANFLNNIVRAKTPLPMILEIMDNLAEAKKYSLAIMDVCEAALCCAEREIAMALFEIMHERTIAVRPHYYWPLLLQASRCEGENEIYRTIKHMLCLNVRLDHDTLYHYVFPYINTYDSLCTVRKFGDIGLETSIFVTPLIAHLLSRGKLDEALMLCSRYRNNVDFSNILQRLAVAYRIDRNIENCVKFLKYAPRDKHYPEEFLMLLYGKEPSQKNIQLVDKFIRAFEAHEIPISSFRDIEDQKMTKTGTTMINSLNNLKLESSNRIPHPQSMSIEELECHLIELRSKGMNKRGVLRRLLMQHCPQNNLTRVMELKKEYNDNGYLWTSGMYANLLGLYIRNDKIEDAISLYVELRNHYTEFKIDDGKIVQFATSLVENKRMDEAITILESSRSKGGPVLSRECWRLLNTIADSEYSDMIENILDILVNGGYCEKTNRILGPLIRRHLLNNDIYRAIDSFKKFTEQHGCTPLRQELINTLLGKIKINDETRDEMTKLLKIVEDCTAKVYGTNGAKVDLFIGYARNGMRQELQKCFENNGMNQKLFTKSLEFVSENDKLLLLTEILDSCTNISSRERVLFYELLLAVYNRLGDTDGAIELWRKMSDEKIRTPRTFIMNFVNLLEKHNVPLPKDFEAT